ncbi:hypothetical protein [Haloarcula amylovorans]|uniref:hypothetical protein n=1 Tax=Haloarcula amylovorans TaxID=2562280 RepID=UPI001076AEEA|nr:hypothetical protein [Halomicroarcula amylolytica]
MAVRGSGFCRSHTFDGGVTRRAVISTTPTGIGWYLALRNLDNVLTELPFEVNVTFFVHDRRISVMLTSLQYQVSLIADTIQIGVIQGAIGPEEATVLKEQLKEVGSLSEAHKLWAEIEQEYDILESEMWADD